jgi:hypothetical protein
VLICSSSALPFGKADIEGNLENIEEWEKKGKERIERKKEKKGVFLSLMPPSISRAAGRE